MMDEATEEHHLVNVLIRELKKLELDNNKFRAKFAVLLVRHHIEEEEGEVLRAAKNSNMNWETLRAKVIKRKE